jgi:molecular chaperone DnaK (HSP70)
VQFEIDADGILKAIVTEKLTNQKVQATIDTRTLTKETVDKLIEEAEANSKQDALTKIILDLQISFEFFCDVLKKRAHDPRVRKHITDAEY